MNNSSPTPGQCWRDKVWDADGLTHVEKLVLLAYGRFAHGDPLRAWVADRALMRWCAIRSKGTPKVTRENLVKKEWLAPLGPLPKHPQITVYLLTAPVTGAVVSGKESLPDGETDGTAPMSEPTAPVTRAVAAPVTRAVRPDEQGSPPRSPGTNTDPRPTNREGEESVTADAGRSADASRLPASPSKSETPDAAADDAEQQQYRRANRIGALMQGRHVTRAEAALIYDAIERDAARTGRTDRQVGVLCARLGFNADILNAWLQRAKSTQEQQ